MTRFGGLSGHLIDRCENKIRGFSICWVGDESAMLADCRFTAIQIETRLSRMEFRSKTHENMWHMSSNCSKWPTDALDVIVLRTCRKETDRNYKMTRLPPSDYRLSSIQVSFQSQLH